MIIQRSGLSHKSAKMSHSKWNTSNMLFSRMQMLKRFSKVQMTMTKQTIFLINEQLLQTIHKYVTTKIKLMTIYIYVTKIKLLIQKTKIHTKKVLDLKELYFTMNKDLIKEISSMIPAWCKSYSQKVTKDLRTVMFLVGDLMVQLIQ